MHFYTTLSLYLLSASASASASVLGSPHTTESPPNAPPSTASPPPTFSLSTLFAYIPTPSTSPHLLETPQQKSWMTFLLTEGAYMTTCSASAGPNDTLASESRYYDCDAVSEYPDVLFAFLVGEGVGRLTVKKIWDSKGTWLTGFAEQGTYWDEGDGGNVTVGPWGKMYERSAEWEFEITRVIG